MLTVANKLVLFGFFAAMTMNSYASVVLNGTRIIFSSERDGKTLQFSNPDNNPNLVQVWIDSDSGASSLEKANSPFVLSPQIFKMEPGSGQVVRVSYVGDLLPSDKETIFYLNFSQVPSFESSQKDSNKLVLLFTSRVKFFYRPKQIQNLVGDLKSRLEFKLDGAGNRISLNNPTGFFLNIRKAEIVQDGQNYVFSMGQMVGPKSTMAWDLKDGFLGGAAVIKMIMINDYGVDEVMEYNLIK